MQNDFGNSLCEMDAELDLVRQLVKKEVRHRPRELLYKRRAQGVRHHHAPLSFHLQPSYTLSGHPTLQAAAILHVKLWSSYTVSCGHPTLSNAAILHFQLHLRGGECAWPHGGVRPFHQNSTCPMELTLGRYALTVWPRCFRTSERANHSNFTVW